MKFLTIKKRTILAIVFAIIFLAISLTTFYSAKTTATPKYTHSIVIDAGHGGKDGGAIGKTTGITESELNLKYAKKLQSLCNEFGFKTIMTRSDMNGLYDEFAQNKKKSEMEKRKNIINNSDADIMISIHMNSFPLSNCSGAQVFYAKGSDLGFNLAKSVQTSLSNAFENARNYVTVGDYFVLNYSSIPSILVECGFLSNPSEESLLQKDEYCEKFCYHILAGIISYFEI
jgi:N-acetylmuramoyl-L-alanine amidase